MPNTLVVSPFDCPFSEFEAMVKKVDKEQGYVFCSELEIVKVNENKAMILMTCSDLEKFGAMLGQPELKQWDSDNNCVDTVYNLELIEWIKILLILVIAALDRLEGTNYWYLCWNWIDFYYTYKFFMGYFQKILKTQPNIVFGVSPATLLLLEIYIALLNLYK